MASHHPIRSFSAAAPAVVASTTTNNNSETDIRGVAAAAMAAAVAAAATGAGVMSWKSEKRADCTAITAVVGKDGFGARCVFIVCFVCDETGSSYPLIRISDIKNS